MPSCVCADSSSANDDNPDTGAEPETFTEYYREWVAQGGRWLDGRDQPSLTCRYATPRPPVSVINTRLVTAQRRRSRNLCQPLAPPSCGTGAEPLLVPRERLPSGMVSRVAAADCSLGYADVMPE